jgi:hypothetical protein
VDTPNITPAMLAGIVIVIVTNALLLFGHGLDADKSRALAAAVNGLFALGFIAADAFMRGRRAQNADKIAHAKNQVPAHRRTRFLQNQTKEQ